MARDIVSNGAAVNPLQRLVRYKAWADRLFYETLAGLPEQDLLAPRPIYFGSMIRTLHHAYAMDRVWQAHLLGQAHGYTSRNPEAHPPFDALWTLQLEMDAWYVDYADRLDPGQQDEIVRFEFIGGGSGAMTRSDILLHVVNHTTYHRGHVADMLYDLSVFPPTTDYPVFVREQAAEA